MFLTSRLAAGADRSPWGSFWFEPVGARTAAGARVTSVSAMRLSAVYSCVRVLAETFAVLPFVLYRKKSGGGRQIITDHWLYRLIARAPNNWQTPFEWREMMMGHLALRGNAFNQMISNGAGEITQLIPLHPDRVRMELLDSGNFRYLIAQRDGSTVTLSRGEVWHLRGLSSDGFIGLNPIEVAAEVFGLGIAAQSYGARFFANDAKPGGWLEMAGKFADGAAREAFKAEWANAQSGANRGRTAMLEPGMKYHELTLNNSDAQFLESRKFSRSEIASIFRVPPHKIGDLEKATFSNIEQQSLEFVNDTMTPWAERWESSLQTHLLFEDENLEVEFDFKNLLRGDSAARGKYYNTGVMTGWLTRNEVRLQEGMDPLDGLDEPLQPLNMTTPGEAADPADAADGSAKPPAAAPDARMLALAGSAAARVARRELETVLKAGKERDWPAAVTTAYEKHAAFVAAALGVNLAAAIEYCSAQASAMRAVREINTDEFTADAAAKLERLALKGTL
jgi:HK97 family phage portal protein